MPTSFSDEPDESVPDPAEVAARRVGEVFAGKWRVERVLGAGGMATVYAATHTNNQRAVALKILHPEFTASGDMKKRFLREGFIANRIGHSGAVNILDDGVDDDGNVFLVMELLTGASVADRIRAGRGSRADATPPRAFDQAEALRIADGVLDVLIAAHAQGILHRDLKPDNVFVTDVGDVKVLDFGIARLREPQSGPSSSDGEAKTRTGVVLGTPQYMPPEQARGRTSLVDERSDLWSVGAIVFAMLTGRHVHEAETPNEALLKAMTATATPIGTVLPGVDPRVAAIVDRALAFEQAARYPDARAMQAEVRETIRLVGSGGAELAPVSGGAALSIARPITGVTGSATPLVRDTKVGRSGGLRIVSVVVVIGASAVAGRELLLRFAPHLGEPQRPEVSLDAGMHVTRKPPPPAITSLPDAAALAATLPDAAPVTAPLVAELADASPALDAGTADADTGDAESDEEDDDGGDEEDEVVFEAPPPVAGHAGHVAAPARHGANPTHKGGEPHKKRKKRKKRR